MSHAPIQIPHLTERTISALVIYVLDPCVQDEDPFPGSLDRDTLTITDLEEASRLLTEAANSADCDGDAELRRALERLQARVRTAQRRAETRARRAA